MKKETRWVWAVAGTALILFLGTAFTVTSGQSVGSQTAPTVTPDQQKQLDQLKQAEAQLQQDRDAMHQAATQYGWDSEQADAAQDQLVRDRMEYRKLRRALRSAGVPVPPPPGMGAGMSRNGPGPMASRMHDRGHGGHHCADCNCPCCKR